MPNTKANKRPHINGKVRASKDNPKATAEGVTYRPITLILTHEGVNLNGYNFLDSELEAAKDTIVGKQINVNHDSGLTSVVGKVLSSEFVAATDDKLAHILCNGVIFDGLDSECVKAWALIQEEVIENVSMECNFETITCSYCDKTFSMSEMWCDHLYNMGSEYEGKLVTGTFHNIDFVGVAILTGPGADPGAKIVDYTAPAGIGLEVHGVTLPEARRVADRLSIQNPTIVERGGKVLIYAAPGELELVDIQGVHVFDAGTWIDAHGRKDTYTEGDISEMASAYNEMVAAGQHEAPLKLGHDPKQPLTDGLPAVGWLRNARADGGKLLVDLVGVPKRLAEYIKARLYSKRSMEISHNLKMAGRAFKNMPTGLALLGANLPALGHLDDIANLFGSAAVSSGLSTYTQDVEAVTDISTTTTANEKTKGGIDNMPTNEELVAELQAKITELEAKISELEAAAAEAAPEVQDAVAEVSDAAGEVADTLDDVSEMAALKEKVTTLEAELAAEREKEFRAKYAAKVNPAMMDEFILPRYRQVVADGKEDSLKSFYSMLDTMQTNPALTEYGRADAGTTAIATGDHAADAIAKAREAAKADGKVLEDLPASAYALYLRAAGYDSATSINTLEGRD